MTLPLHQIDAFAAEPFSGNPAAVCLLGPYWQEVTARNPLRAWQASRRGGEVGMEVEGDTALLLGRAVTVLRGELAEPGK